MKIGLLTLPVETGYGSIMQAFALKSALEKHGHQVIFIRRLRKKYNYNLKRILRRTVKKYFLGKTNTVIFIDRKENKEYPIITQNTQHFIDTHLKPFSPIYLSSRDFKNIENIGLDAIVVGSDQVWRPGCMDNIEDYFLYGIDKPIKRYAYAASLGIDKWNYSKKQTEHCREAVRKFNLVSVREKSGVDLCNRYLGIMPTLVLDPTLLFENKFYLSLVQEHDPNKDHKICAFILDRSQEKLDLLSKWCSGIHKCFVFAANNTEDRQAPLKDRIAPSVESWLDCFNSSDCVFTDSFHGCVFSIIFRKPFYVYINANRGADRFNSLLSLFDLQECIINENTRFDIIPNIDWIKVEKRLNEMRVLSNNFISSIN